MAAKTDGNGNISILEKETSLDDKDIFVYEMIRSTVGTLDDWIRDYMTPEQTNKLQPYIDKKNKTNLSQIQEVSEQIASMNFDFEISTILNLVEYDDDPTSRNKETASRGCRKSYLYYFMH